MAVEQDIACPESRTRREPRRWPEPPSGALACFGSDPITFRGWWPEIPEDAGLGGACAFEEEPSGCSCAEKINYNGILADDTEDFFGIGVQVSIDPSTDAAMPDRGTWVEVRVHLDDPAAARLRRGCGRRVRARGPASSCSAAVPRWRSRRRRQSTAPDALRPEACTLGSPAGTRSGQRRREVGRGPTGSRSTRSIRSSRIGPPVATSDGRVAIARSRRKASDAAGRRRRLRPPRST